MRVLCPLEILSRVASCKLIFKSFAGVSWLSTWLHWKRQRQGLGPATANSFWLMMSIYAISRISMFLVTTERQLVREPTAAHLHVCRRTWCSRILFEGCLKTTQITRLTDLFLKWRSLFFTTLNSMSTFKFACFSNSQEGHVSTWYIWQKMNPWLFEKLSTLRDADGSLPTNFSNYNFSLTDIIEYEMLNIHLVNLFIWDKKCSCAIINLHYLIIWHSW